jgi:pyruvate,water dikinase
VSSIPVVLPLSKASEYGESSVGGKGDKLGRLISAGYKVPRGFCITVKGYDGFLRAGRLVMTIQMELGRKPLSDMRWEEIWDSALRIRRAFLSSEIPESIAGAILNEALALRGPLAVRSSAPGEDSASKSYAGLHESLIGVVGGEALLDAVRVVWASLWSDAALLYRRELGLDPLRSSMAVVVQELVTADVSGVGFGRDPRDVSVDREIVEAVPGPCSGLVDGLVDPDRWIIRKSSGEILEWRPGDRESGGPPTPLLREDDLDLLHRTLAGVESMFGWAPDVEWTSAAEGLTLLQARPVTAPKKRDESDDRDWYLTLRPGTAKLNLLAKKVTEDLIPRLEEEGDKLAREEIESLSDEELAGAIETRLEAVERWKRIYWDEFIPFAHGVRQLAVYYNDAVKPSDPYEFIGLLRNQPMIAVKRNEALMRLAEQIRENPTLRDVLSGLGSSKSAEVGVGAGAQWPDLEAEIEKVRGGYEFIEDFRGLLREYMDIAHGGERLSGRPDLILRSLLELSGSAGERVARSGEPRESAGERAAAGGAPDAPTAEELEKRLLRAVGVDREQEALAAVEIARLSWRLRDDDNILVGRLEDQLLRSLEEAAARLRESGRLGTGSSAEADHAGLLARALRETAGGAVDLPEKPKEAPETGAKSAGEKARQILGQPAAPGVATGVARIVREVEDLGKFSAGEILVCDSIQPTMSHLVPLAAAIAERRGGMLIHGAIVARELGIPCVNGLKDVVSSIEDGEVVTVDGYLGIVTVGPPEFEMERVGRAKIKPRGHE